jgi:hypothetical protein
MVCLASALVLAPYAMSTFFLEKGQHHKINKLILWDAGFTGHMQLTLLVPELVDCEEHYTL